MELIRWSRPAAPSACRTPQPGVPKCPTRTIFDRDMGAAKKKLVRTYTRASSRALALLSQRSSSQRRGSLPGEAYGRMGRYTHFQPRPRHGFRAWGALFSYCDRLYPRPRSSSRGSEESPRKSCRMPMLNYDRMTSARLVPKFSHIANAVPGLASDRDRDRQQSIRHTSAFGMERTTTARKARKTRCELQRTYGVRFLPSIVPACPFVMTDRNKWGSWRAIVCMSRCAGLGVRGRRGRPGCFPADPARLLLSAV
jgi:hypothetical protein